MQPTGTSAPNPAVQFAANQAAMYAKLNTAAIAIWRKAMAFYTSQYGTQPNLAIPGTPLPPTPPPEFVFNQALWVACYEQQSALLSAGDFVAAAAVDYSQCLSVVQFIPIPNPPPPIVAVKYNIGVPVDGLEGWFQVTDSNNSRMADGVVINPSNNSNAADPHGYITHLFGPMGSVLAQMTN